MKGGGDCFMKYHPMLMITTGTGIDSIEESEPRWIFATGFDQSWEELGPRKNYTGTIGEQ